jgi:UDP-N-acetylmuramyl pentapeptide phosphotransferase/UDP-N-acetylglucosamine-1-phosphate transferase
MLLLITAFAVSFLVTLCIVRGAKGMERMVGDHDLLGPQKFHAQPVPRIGGLGIVLGVMAGAIVLAWREPPALSWSAFFWAARCRRSARASPRT